VHFQLSDRLADDPFFLRGGFGFLELIKEVLDRIFLRIEIACFAGIKKSSI